MFITKTNVNLFHQLVIYKYFKAFKGYNFSTPIEMQAPNSCPTKNESDQTLVLSSQIFICSLVNACGQAFTAAFCDDRLSFSFAPPPPREPTGLPSPRTREPATQVTCTFTFFCSVIMQ